jgi:hypothetical protein
MRRQFIAEAVKADTGVFHGRCSLYLFFGIVFLLIILGQSVFQPILYSVHNGNLPALSSAFCHLFQTILHQAERIEKGQLTEGQPAHSTIYQQRKKKDFREGRRQELPRHQAACFLPGTERGRGRNLNDLYRGKFRERKKICRRSI